MTYSPDHVDEDARRMAGLMDALSDALSDLRRMLDVYDDAIQAPGRNPGCVPDRDAVRQATHGPVRPTERLVLDDARAALRAELKMGASHLPYAVAYVRGTFASMDRALSRWEGCAPDTGGVNENHHRPAGN
ncbi:DUF7169 domain-containing protein [Streptomyces tsukubensis]|uniref:DUF7169 domain-containing protein n=1 Tax=Streptomyces tsukubensis TaxID=83656 RepID=UPI003450D597